MILSIIVPVHNEHKTIKDILKKLSVLNLKNTKKQIIVIDDYSTDGSKEVIYNLKKTKKFEYDTIFHKKNLGKGQAIKSGLDIATGDLILIQDADLEYDPQDIKYILNEYIKSSKNGKSRKIAVYGNRGRKRYPQRGYHYVLGAMILTNLVNIIFGSKLKDLYTGYKLFHSDFLKNIDIASHGFEFEAEATIKLIKKGYEIVEVPISYHPRNRKDGKHINYKDFFKGFFTILKQI